MLDEIQEIPWSYVIEFLSGFSKLFVEFNNSIMHAHDCVNQNCVAGIILLNGRAKRFSYWIYNESKLFGNLIQAFLRPVSEPVDHTSIEQCRRGSRTVAKIWIIGIHSEYHMQIPLHVLYKQLVDFIVIGDIL